MSIQSNPTIAKFALFLLLVSSASQVFCNIEDKEWVDDPFFSRLVCEAGDELTVYQQSKYRRDATRLALRLRSKDQSYHEMGPEAPSDMVESIYSALVAVHQSELKAAKLITNTHKLHTFPNPSVDRFFVVYKKEAAWATPLRLGDNSTNSEKINKLLSEYGLVIDKHVEWDDEHNSFNVRATSSLNMAPIAQQFSSFQDIVLVDLLLPNGDGNDITIKKISSGWELSYVIKFDSCIIWLCQTRHVVGSFEVNENA